MAESVNCYDLGAGLEDEIRLYNDLEEVCYKGQHIWMVMFVSVPGLILWAFGIPFFALQQLTKFFKGVEDSKVYSNPNLHVTMADRFGLRFGFLTSGYQKKYYYWEVFLILRKTVIVLLITFLAPVSSGA